MLPSPPVRHHDSKGPFNISDLVIVTGATASFFDRLTNMVGSVHVWEPQQKVVVYDLGFSQSQLAKMMCWRNVEVRERERAWHVVGRAAKGRRTAWTTRAGIAFA